MVIEVRRLLPPWSSDVQLLILDFPAWHVVRMLHTGICCAIIALLWSSKNGTNRGDTADPDLPKCLEPERLIVFLGP